MCGFVSIVNFDGRSVSPDVIERMCSAIIHRGPDDSGIFTDASMGFGFRRLSILDLTPAGHQPMISADGSLVIVFNGEIYNFIELREELIGLGHSFESRGDTEVLLHAFQEWGADCLNRLNGMWAFLIYDRRNRKIFGSRDRFGVKPLFVHRTETGALFGSEIKALQASGMLPPGRTNWRVAKRFLSDGELDCDHETFFEGIEQIPPGSAFELGLDGSFRQWRYWSIPQDAYDPMTDPVEVFAETFEDTVKLRMRSDVPVGVCLSGGLDSTSIICSMARASHTEGLGGAAKLHAFCYADPLYDESPYINATLEQTGAELNKLLTDGGELYSSALDVLGYHDEPYHTLVGVVGFRLMELIKNRGIKVVLNGQGADESWAGYPNYFGIRWRSMLRQGRISAFLDDVRAYADGHSIPAKSIIAKTIRELVQFELSRLGPYRALADWKRQSSAGADPWLADEVNRHTEEASWRNIRSLQDALFSSVQRKPLPLYLRIEDRNSMAHSIEARLPFMDYRLISLAFSLSDSHKLNGPLNKFLLRQAMKGRIPDVAQQRVDKMGFAISQGKMFAGPLYEPMQDLLASQSLRERGVFNVDRIRADLERHRRGEADFGFQLFRVAQFELWSRIRIDKPYTPEPVETPREPSYA